MDNPAYLRKVAEAPPQVLHLGMDIPFKTLFGSRQQTGPKTASAELRLLDAETDAELTPPEGPVVIGPIVLGER